MGAEETRMRPFPLLAFTALFGCSGGDPDDTSPGDTDTPADDTDDGDDTDAGDTDADDTDGGDTDDEWPDPGPDFAAHGPGAGYHWFLEPAPTDASYTHCGVGSANSFGFYSDTWQLQSPSTSLMQFAIALQATPGGTLVCDYEADGTFTCSTTTFTQDLRMLPSPYTMDAVVTMNTTGSGRFRERVDVDPSTSEAHTYSARWAADLDLTFSASCTGSECASASAAMGAEGFPCTSTFTSLASVNYSDPTLTDPR
jgi:hypothetical protein